MGHWPRIGIINKIKVLIIDNSSAVRKMLLEILVSNPQIEVVGLATDSFIAAKRIHAVIPDVIIQDIEMSRKDSIFEIISKIEIDTKTTIKVPLERAGGVTGMLFSY